MREILIRNEEEIREYLEDVKQAIRKGKYNIALREKNEKLSIQYIFLEDMKKKILLDLRIHDFCEAVQNEKPEYSHEILYVFGKDVYLLPRFGGEKEKISLYIKINKLQSSFCIIVSFHEQEFPLIYAFK